MDRQALEGDASIFELQNYVHVSQIVVKLDLPHGLDLGELLSVALEDPLENLWEIEGVSLIVDWPVAFAHHYAMQILRLQYLVGYNLGFLSDLFVDPLRVLEVLYDDVACLQSLFSESLLQPLQINNFLVNTVVLGPHQLLGEHHLIFADERLLRSVQINQNSY